MDKDQFDYKSDVDVCFDDVRTILRLVVLSITVVSSKPKSHSHNIPTLN